MNLMRMLATALVLVSASLRAAPVAPDPAHLKPGEYVWHPELAPEGPLVVVVSLDEQRVYVYRNGIAIGLSTISSGRKGYETPPGVFTILQKDRDHHSNKYDDAPMPYMERLTWDGVALHGGTLPGYPASHGCVRLPQGFAERLFAITRRGETVVVADSKVTPAPVVHPAALAPVGASGETLALPSGERYVWNDALAPEGPVSILVSLGDRRVHVLRDGVRIGSAALDVAEGFALSGTLLFVIGEGYEYLPSTLDASQPRHRWTVYPIGAEAPASIDALAGALRVDEAFARKVYAMLVPGTTIVVTAYPAVREVEPRALQPIFEAGPAR